jgi:hypothetical protein
MYIYEHVLASHYKWTLDYIRDLDIQDFYAHLRMCLVKDGCDKEFQAKIAGAMPSEGSENVEGKTEVVGSQRLKSGAVKQTEISKTHIRKRVGGLKMNKVTGEVVTFEQPEFEDEENDLNKV